MRLASLRAENYRTFESVNLPFSKHYCPISGMNNAGKSGVVRLLSVLLRSGGGVPWFRSAAFDYRNDKTQWVREQAPIEISYTLELTKAEDPALISFIGRVASTPITGETLQLELTYVVTSNDELTIKAALNGEPVTQAQAARDIDKRIKESNLLFLHNSTTRSEEYYYGRSGARLLYGFVLSSAERKVMDEAERNTERKLRRVTKAHTQSLSEVLGRLSDKYEVEVSPPEGITATQMPLGISLRDKSVEVPLDAWGSGTQNRTRIMSAILQAYRIKTSGDLDDKSTPIVVIEEPESFLHPSAQAEFGRLLRNLSEDFGIQIIVTTHSPHMLNQQEPTANILLAREVRRKRPLRTYVVDSSGDNWMVPFADHLGIGPEEFSSLRPLFSTTKTHVLLVEGHLDREYFEYLQSHDIGCEILQKDIAIVPYGGKDTLRNTLLIQFVVRQFDKVFITFDRDAHGDVAAALARASLVEKKDFISLGLPKAGRDCIEGLLPERVISAVHQRCTDLVMALSSAKSDERRRAKEQLKKEYLKEFVAGTYQPSEVAEISRAVREINRVFAS